MEGMVMYISRYNVNAKLLWIPGLILLQICCLYSHAWSQNSSDTEQPVRYSAVAGAYINYADLESPSASVKDRTISLHVNNKRLINALQQVANQLGLSLSYSKEQLPGAKRVTVNLDEVTVNEAVYSLLEGTGLRYAISANGHLVFFRKQEPLKEKSLIQFEVVTGTVTDAETDNTMPGVNILVKGTLTGTSTDSDGNYSLDVPALSDTLVFSFIGYQTREVPINGRTRVDVALQPQTVVGEEMVVTAFGLERAEKSLSYSTEGVSAEQLTEARELNVINSLQGRVAGVNISQAGGGVGSESRVVLRGNRSISGDSQPLYVVDGVPIRGDISDMSPNNIASLNVLKGPSAAALYGSAAQNGAIIVETKTARAGEVNVSLNSTFMVGQPIHSLEFQNVYGQGVSGIYNPSAEASWGPKMEGQMVDHWSPDPAVANAQYAFLPQPDNYKKMFQLGYNLATNLQASIGGETTQTVFSYTRTDARGMIPNNNLGRHNISVRVTSQLTDWLTLDTKLAYMKQHINNPIHTGDDENFNPYRNLYLLPRNISHEQYKDYQYIDEEGLIRQNYWSPGSTTGKNPYWTMYRQLRNEDQEELTAFTSLTIDFTDYLSLMGRVSFDGGGGSLETKVYADSYGAAYQYGYYGMDMNDSEQWYSDFLLSYAQDVAEDWSVNAHLGGSIRKSSGIGSLSTATTEELLVPNFFTLSNTQFPGASFNPVARTETQSLYVTANLGWRNVIYLDVTGRNDWSSTLPPDSRSYFYPSVGISAILSDLIALPEAVTYAQLRASWAKVGNSAPAYMLTRTGSFDAGGNNGFFQLGSVLPNKELKPEQTESFEVGLDLRFLEGRLGLDFTAYKTNTYNQLFTIALPTGSGASSFFTNGGNVENKGIEMLLSATPVQTNNFIWDLNFNFSLNRNMVISISDERPRVIVGGDSYFRQFVVEQGEEFGNIYGRGFQRDEQGRVIVGPNGIPLSTDGRTVKIANANPDWMGGLSSTLSYQNFSLSFLIEHRQGGTIASATNAVLYYKGVLEGTLKGREGGLVFGQNFFPGETAVLADGSPNNIEITAQEFWRNVGGRNTPVGEAFVQSATNMRLRELALTYSLPQSVLSGSAISNVEISLVGRNLFFIYRESTWDPGILTGTDPEDVGFQSFVQPSRRNFGLSVNIDF